MGLTTIRVESMMTMMRGFSFSLGVVVSFGIRRRDHLIDLNFSTWAWCFFFLWHPAGLDKNDLFKVESGSGKIWIWILVDMFCCTNSFSVHYALLNTLTTMTSTTKGSLHQELFCFTATLLSPMPTTLPQRLRGGKKVKYVRLDYFTILVYDGKTAADNCL